MFQYRQVLVRMRQGDTDREIARAGLMGRPKAARAAGAGRRRKAGSSPRRRCPRTPTIAAVARPPRRRAPVTVSTVEPLPRAGRALGRAAASRAWRSTPRCVASTATRGSYSAVRRMLAAIGAARAARGDRAAALRARRGRAGRLRRRPDARSTRRAASRAHLVLRDDAVPARATSTSSSSGTRRWRPGSAATAAPSSGSARCPSGSSSTTPSARSPGLRARPAGAARLRRVRRRLRLPDRPVSAAPTRRRRASSRRASSTSRATSCRLRELPRPRRPERPGARAG